MIWQQPGSLLTAGVMTNILATGMLCGRSPELQATCPIGCAAGESTCYCCGGGIVELVFRVRHDG